MTRRLIEQTELDNPDVMVPCTIVAVSPPFSRGWDQEVVPVHLRVGSSRGDVVVRAWLLRRHPTPETAAHLLGHQLRSLVGTKLQFGIDGAWLEIWTAEWKMRLRPLELIEKATETIVLRRVEKESADW